MVRLPFAASSSLLILGTTVAWAAVAAAPQGPPSTDIWLAPLTDGAVPVLGVPVNATDRDGYDNQPSFEPEGAGLLYTSQRDGQTDIYRLDLGTMASSPVTATAESEYSPTVMPNGREISVIRVESDGAQRLWAFPRNGEGEPRVLLAEVAPVGYHSWGDDDELVLFVLGQPATLQLANVSTGVARIIGESPGRSLHTVGERVYRYVGPHDDDAWIHEYDAARGTATALAPALAESPANDMVITPAGTTLMAAGADVYALLDGEWTAIADLSAAGITTITRLAVHPDGDRLAMVVAR